MWVTCNLKCCEGLCKILEGRDLFQRVARIASISGALPAHGYVLHIKSLTLVDLPAAVLNKKTPAQGSRETSVILVDPTDYCIYLTDIILVAFHPSISARRRGTRILPHLHQNVEIHPKLHQAGPGNAHPKSDVR